MKTRYAVLFAPLFMAAGLALAQQAEPKGAQKPAELVPASAPAADARAIAAQKPSYPLDTCPISHQKLGGMGEPVDMLVDGHLVRLCCGKCKGAVEKDRRFRLSCG